MVFMDEARAAAQLVDHELGLVGRKIFSDPGIYQMELEQIFARCWLYLGHESQLPNPGDYINVNMGEEPVLVVRSPKGKINAFINSCRHRGNRVCRSDAGNTAAFLCTYHGWTYDTEGKLIGVPGHKELYHGELNRTEWGLPQVAQVASYKGLIFGTFDPDAPSLDEYLGDMRWWLDVLLDQGDMEVVPGIVRWQIDANWKFAADNAIGDNYHGITHLSSQIAGHASAEGTRKKALPKAGSALVSLWLLRTVTGSTLTTSTRIRLTGTRPAPTGVRILRFKNAWGLSGIGSIEATRTCSPISS